MFFFLAIAFVFLGLYLLHWLIFGRRNTSTQPLTFEQSVHFPAETLPVMAVILTAFHLFLYNTLETNLSVLPGLGIALFNLVALGCIGFLLKDTVKKHKLLLLPMAVSAFLGLALVFRANGFVQSVNLLSIKMIFWFLLAVYSFDALQAQGIWIFKKMVGLIPKWFKQIFKLSDRSTLPNEKIALSFQASIKTIVITCGVLLLFTILLMNADPVFADRVSNILDQVLGRVLTSIIVVAASASIISLRVKYKEDEKEQMAFFAVHDLLVPMVAVALLFGFFISIQLQYLFAGKGDLTALNLTYSEYVRKGFLELLVTAFLGGFFVYLAAIKSRLSHGIARVQWLRVASAVVVGELFFLLASALKRDLMYVDVYGLTRVRIVGGMFIIWLAVVFCSLLALIFIKKMKEKSFLYSVATISAVVVLALNILNIDTLVITGKTAHHTYTDHFYISNLSEDSASAWKSTIDAISTDTKALLEKQSLSDVERSQLAGLKLALISIQERRDTLYLKYAPAAELVERHEALEFVLNEENTSRLPDFIEEKRNWENYNVSEARAYTQLTSDKELFFNHVDALLRDIRAFQRERQLDLFNEEQRLLYEFSYPFISIDLDYYPEGTYTLYNNENLPLPPSPTSLVSPSPVAQNVNSIVPFNQLLQDVCLLEPREVYVVNAWVTTANSGDYFISETSDRMGRPMARAILAEDISKSNFNANLPSYKKISLKSSGVRCDTPVIVNWE